MTSGDYLLVSHSFLFSFGTVTLELATVKIGGWWRGRHKKPRQSQRWPRWAPQREWPCLNGEIGGDLGGNFGWTEKVAMGHKQWGRRLRVMFHPTKIRGNETGASHSIFRVSEILGRAPKNYRYWGVIGTAMERHKFIFWLSLGSWVGYVVSWKCS